MFGEDRFSEDEDYYSTYQYLGGNTLSEKELRTIVNAWFEQMMKDYLNPAFFDAFPKSRFFLEKVSTNWNLPKTEMDRLEELISLQEVGTISKTYAWAIQKLANSHQLGLVSNIWSEEYHFSKKLKEAKLYDLFKVIVFSSNHGIIKPSKKLFEKAFEAFDCPKEKMIYIGDSLTCDVIGGKNAGISTVWISHGRQIPKYFSDRPTYTIENLLKLIEP